MLNREELTDIIKSFEPEAEFPESKQLLEVFVSADNYFSLIEKLKSDKRTALDYLINQTAVDFQTHFTIVCHLESTEFHHLVVVKSNLTDREKPAIDSISSLYLTAEFQEREIFDLFGIRFNNHPDLRRLFLEDDYGYPLRKDFRDEVNMIER